MIHNSRNGFAATGCRKKNGSTYTTMHPQLYYRIKTTNYLQKSGMTMLLVKSDIAKTYKQPNH